MKYYISRKIKSGFIEALENITHELKKEGFGIMSEINMSRALKEKLDADIPHYRILGACNPEFAYRAFKSDDMIGTMLPCNIIVYQKENNYVVVAAIDPEVAMKIVKNEEIDKIAKEVKTRITKAISQL